MPAQPTSQAPRRKLMREPAMQPDALSILVEINGKLGELSGQVRELVHTANNTSQKVDALGLRVAALEAEQQQRVGASNVLATILKSPALGWLVGAVVTIWAVVTGKVHP